MSHIKLPRAHNPILRLTYHKLIYPVDLGGHAVAMAVFGYAGYWAHVYETRTGEYLAMKRAEVAERRERRIEAEAARLGAVAA